jgi:hypothetical protein
VAPAPVKLWHYASLARLWSWSLVVSAGLLLGVAAALRAGTDEGIDPRWLGIVVAVAGVTGVLGYPALRVWLARSAMPSLRLSQAQKDTGPRRLPAAPGDWRRWSILTTTILTMGGSAMLVFLVGVLGGGGTAEGVVVGLLAAWGLATLGDARQIERSERAEGRRYYAAVARPAAVGDHLVWIAAEREPEAASPQKSPL